MALAVEALRLRQQEFSLLSHLHRLRSPRSDLNAGLSALLDSARVALNADGLFLQVRPMTDERISNLRVQSGLLPLDLPSGLEAALRLALEETRPQQASAADEIDWVVEPVMLPEGQVLGTLYALRHAHESLLTNRWGAIHTVAAQAALMIENERVTLSLEYSLVIQERTRLAREIHDGLAQTLAYLKMQSAQMQAALSQGDQARLTRLLQENRAALADAYNETRQAIDNLRLNPDEGLFSWIEQAVKDFEKASGIQVEVVIPKRDLELVPEIQAHLVRIVQEALNNVRKHAHANGVRISLRQWENDLILEVVDDGRGFDPEDVPVAAQYGLRGMRERAELIGAEFQITSQPASGTTVRVYIPFQIQELGK
jgi:two-component system nitrate/nitrite sensor histidine kinase NarX